MTEKPLSEWTEQDRINQGGLGWVAYHAALTWMRQLAAYANECHGVLFEEVSDPERGVVYAQQGVSWRSESFSMTWEGVGHLLISMDGKTWYGMDMTYYPPTELAWSRMTKRVGHIREHPGNFKSVRVST